MAVGRTMRDTPPLERLPSPVQNRPGITTRPARLRRSGAEEGSRQAGTAGRPGMRIVTIGGRCGDRAVRRGPPPDAAAGSGARIGHAPPAGSLARRGQAPLCCHGVAGSAHGVVCWTRRDPVGHDATLPSGPRAGSFERFGKNVRRLAGGVEVGEGMRGLARGMGEGSDGGGAGARVVAVERGLRAAGTGGIASRAPSASTMIGFGRVRARRQPRGTPGKGASASLCMSRARGSTATRASSALAARIGVVLALRGRNACAGGGVAGSWRQR